MQKQTIVMAMLVLLILVSAMQTVQLANIQNKITGYTAQQSYANTQSQNTQQQPPSGLQQLPQQVGGC